MISVRSPNHKNCLGFLLLFPRYILIITISLTFLSGIVVLISGSRMGGSSRHWTSTTTVVEPFVVSSEKTVNRHRQRVMILVGPIQTGLGQVNTDMSRWSKEYKLGTSWSWSTPDIVKYNYTREQGFDRLVDALVYGLSHNLEMGPRFNDPHREAADFFLKEYRASFVAEWMKKKSIIIGSEKFNIIVNQKGGEKVLSSLIRILPWNHPDFSLSGSNSDIGAFVLYRPSRMRHLISVWREMMTRSQKLLTFSEWLTLSTDWIDYIDTLGMVEKFLKVNIPVTIIDVEDVSKNKKQDLSHFISCRILKVPCTNNNNIIGVEDEFNSTANLLFDFTNEDDMEELLKTTELDEITLEQVDDVLKKYDCNFEYFRSHEKVTVFDKQFESFFPSCSSRNDTGSSTITISREQLSKKIMKIVHTVE